MSGPARGGRRLSFRAKDRVRVVVPPDGSLHSGATPFACAIGTVHAVGLEEPFTIRVWFDDEYAYRFRVTHCRFTPEELVAAPGAAG